ncbi:BatA domain-containing protein [Planctomycetaceae bacterium]|nr:BatA domain-containing protein [bacterium]MDB4679632.1 BatA domain-containing protein [Planctomycetaceae bacterium]MDC0261983.1 BatA domain-containing protein [Planctomycetaceae bacterium]MDC0273905.1 BatA domain-containing protein [Planctomycetaceae bacterium]
MPFYFANPWGLLGLLSLPAIAAIHMFHHRYPPLLITGSHLWGAEMQVTTAGRKRERLPITASLLLELLAALLIALTLANPIFGNTGRVTHLIVVLDNSASMQAVTPTGETFRQAALKKLEERLRNEERDTVLTLMTTGRRIQKLAGPVNWNEARDSLAQWKPNETIHDVQPAWDRAVQLAAGQGQLLYLTDHMPEESLSPPDEMEIISVGQKLANVGFTTARWIYDATEQQGLLFLRLANYGPQETDLTITGTVKDQELFSRKTKLSAKSTAPLEIPIPGGVGEVRIILSAPDDALEIDNVVTLIEPKVRTVKVDLTLPADHPGREPVERIVNALADAEITTAENPHLQISSASTKPASSIRKWWLGIGPMSAEEANQEQAKDLLGPYLLEKQNPILEGVVLGGVVWGGAQAWPYEVIPMVSAGATPLMGRLTGTLTTGFALNIDLSRSNLTQSPDWPILLMNLIEERRNALPGLSRWNYRLNEDIQFRLYEGLVDPDEQEAAPLTLVSESDTKPVLRSEVVFIGAQENPGVYTIKSGENIFGKFAVNFFDPRESNLSNLTPGRRTAAKTPVQLFALDDPFSWLILLGSALILLAVLVDWFVLKPKVRSS